MKSKFIHATVSLVVFLGLSLALVFLTASRHSEPAVSADARADEHGAAEPAHCADCELPDEHDECEDHEQATHEPRTLEQLQKLQCQHACATIDCDECRYELGVAKLNPSLAEGLVQTQRVQVEQSLRNALQLTGEIHLDLTRVVEIASAGSGRVETIDGLLGDTVQAADTLAVIQSAEFGQAQADFLEAQAKLDLARQTYEREKTLVDQKISSQADFLTARKEFVATQVALAAARKRLQLFGLSDRQIELLATTDPDEKFGQLVLTTPTAGTILEQNVVRGQLVSPAQRLYRIADLSRVWVWCNLYEADLAALYERMASSDKVEAELRIAAFPAQAFRATVDLLGNEVDRETRTLRVRLVADNVQGKLKPGMFVTALVPLAECEPVVHVPESAVLTDEGEHFVFAQLTDELWIRRDIVVGHHDKGQVEVLAGLSEGETIATQGAFMFKSEVLKEKMGAGCAQ